MQTSSAAAWSRVLAHLSDRALSFNHITQGDLWALCALLGVGYVYIFDYLGSLSADSPLLRMHDACLFKCQSDSCVACMKKSRDEHYYPKVDHSGCAFTVWELTHAAFHAYLGYKYNFWISFSISVGFEVFEHFFKDCGSWMDIIWNAGGCLFGLLLRVMVDESMASIQ